LVVRRTQDRALPGLFSVSPYNSFDDQAPGNSPEIVGEKFSGRPARVSKNLGTEPIRSQSIPDLTTIIFIFLVQRTDHQTREMFDLPRLAPPDRDIAATQSRSTCPFEGRNLDRPLFRKTIPWSVHKPSVGPEWSVQFHNGGDPVQPFQVLRPPTGPQLLPSVLLLVSGRLRKPTVVLPGPTNQCSVWPNRPYPSRSRPLQVCPSQAGTFSPARPRRTMQTPPLSRSGRSPAGFRHSGHQR